MSGTVRVTILQVSDIYLTFHYQLPILFQILGFTKAAKTEKSHEQTLTASKGIAVTAWRIIVDEDFYGQVKQTFDDQMKNFNSI